MQGSAGGQQGAGPSMSTNQSENATSATIAVTAKIRGRIPSCCSCPAARRRMRHTRSSRVASPSVSISVAIIPKNVTTSASVIDPAW